jgi:hypothetical protein
LNETPSLANYGDTVVVNLAVGGFLSDLMEGVIFVGYYNACSLYWFV